MVNKKQLIEVIGWGIAAICIVKSVDLIHTFTIWWHPLVFAIAAVFTFEKLGDYVAKKW